MRRFTSHLGSLYVPVAGHKVRIKIGDITATSGMQSPPQNDATLFFCDSDGNAVNTGDESGDEEVTTDASDAEGAATFRFKAGPQVMQASEVHFKAVEKTQTNG